MRRELIVPYRAGRADARVHMRDALAPARAPLQAAPSGTHRRSSVVFATAARYQQGAASHNRMKPHVLAAAVAVLAAVSTGSSLSPAVTPSKVPIAAFTEWM